MRVLLSVIILIFSASCTNIPTRAEFERQLSEAARGKHIEAISKQLGLGYHTRTIKTANGNDVYIYENDLGNSSVHCHSSRLSEEVTTTNCSGGERLSCSFSFEVNSTGVIVNTDVRGNRCPEICKPGFIKVSLAPLSDKTWCTVATEESTPTATEQKTSIKAKKNWDCNAGGAGTC